MSSPKNNAPNGLIRITLIGEIHRRIGTRSKSFVAVEPDSAAILRKEMKFRGRNL